MSASYQVVVKNFADTTTFGPGAVKTILTDAVNVGWSEYLNDVGECFFTVSQEDPKIQDLKAAALTYGYHVHVYRNGVLVWGGWLGEADETISDVVFHAYSYISGFYHYVTAWDTEWVSQNADKIIEDTFDYAKALAKSRVGWLTKGTIQTLWVESGGPTTLAMPLYKASYKRALSVFREIAAYAISDTTNRVKFEVTPAGVFNLWRNDMTALSDQRWALGSRVRSYRRIRLPVDRRNEILAVGSSPQDVALRTTVTKTAHRDAWGLKQEPIYLQWVRDASELSRVANLRAGRAVRVDSDFYVFFFKDSVVPFRATGADYSLGDTIDFTISRGLTGLSAGAGEEKIVAGQQVIFRDGSEYVRALLTDKLG